MVRVFFAIKSLHGETPSRSVVVFYRCTSFQIDFEKVGSIFESYGFLSSTIVTVRAVLKEARPGERIELLPGEYEFSGESIDVAREGAADAPITLAARHLGDATLKFRLVEGFHVHAPYWKFENLVIDGVCRTDSE